MEASTKMTVHPQESVKMHAPTTALRFGTGELPEVSG